MVGSEMLIDCFCLVLMIECARPQGGSGLGFPAPRHTEKHKMPFGELTA